MAISWQTVRDLLLAVLAVAATAALDYLTGWLSTQPLGNAAVTAAIIAGLTLLRRWINPTVPVAQAWTANDRVALNQPTPIVPAFAVAPDIDDENFMLACATQVQAYTPGGKIVAFDPATLIAVLIQLFLTNVDLEALVRRAAEWIIGLFARWQLRKAAKAALATKGVPTDDRIAGVVDWLIKTDPSVLRRVRMIADSRRHQS